MQWVFLLPDNSVAKHLYFRDGIHLNNHGTVFMPDKMYNVTVHLDKFFGIHPLTDIVASNVHNYCMVFRHVNLPQIMRWYSFE
jgi:hypothetical protein